MWQRDLEVLGEFLACFRDPVHGLFVGDQQRRLPLHRLADGDEIVDKSVGAPVAGGNHGAGVKVPGSSRSRLCQRNTGDVKLGERAGNGEAVGFEADDDGDRNGFRNTECQNLFHGITPYDSHPADEPRRVPFLMHESCHKLTSHRKSAGKAEVSAVPEVRKISCHVS